MDRLNRLTGPRALRGWAVASLVANIVLIVTGGVVRLTDSGLGCPTWPRCTDTSLVTTAAMGIHGVIEFANRMLFFVLGLIALATFAVALCRRQVGHRRRDLVALTLILGLGIPFQGVIGGLTVLSKLNPYVVALHLVFSLGLVAVAVLLVHRVYDWRPREIVGGMGRLPLVVFVLMWVTVWLGTVVTGSGPHAGDVAAPRNGLDSELVSHIHAIAVYATVFLTLVTMILLRSRAALLLLVVEVLQATVGFIQYYNGLPIGVVVFHLLGAGLAIAAATHLLLAYRDVRPADAVTDQGVGAPSDRRLDR